MINSCGVGLGTSIDLCTFACGIVDDSFVATFSVMTIGGTGVGVSVVEDNISSSGVGGIFVSNISVVIRSGGSVVVANVTDSVADGSTLSVSLVMAAVELFSSDVSVAGTTVVCSAVEGFSVSKFSVTTTGGTALGASVVEGNVTDSVADGSTLSVSVVMVFVELLSDVSVAGATAVEGLSVSKLSVTTTGGTALADSVVVADVTDSVADGSTLSVSLLMVVVELLSDVSVAGTTVVCSAVEGFSVFKLPVTTTGGTALGASAVEGNVTDSVADGFTLSVSLVVAAVELLFDIFVAGVTVVRSAAEGFSVSKLSVTTAGGAALGAFVVFSVANGFVFSVSLVMATVELLPGVSVGGITVVCSAAEDFPVSKLSVTIVGGTGLEGVSAVELLLGVSVARGVVVCSAVEGCSVSGISVITSGGTGLGLSVVVSSVTGSAVSDFFVSTFPVKATVNV